MAKKKEEVNVKVKKLVRPSGKSLSKTAKHIAIMHSIDAKKCAKIGHRQLIKVLLDAEREYKAYGRLIF